MMSQKKRILLCVLLALVLVVSAGFLVPAIRVRVLGFFRGEAFYDGLPASSWSQRLQSEWPDAGPFMPIYFDLRDAGKAVLPVLMEIAFTDKSPGQEQAKVLLVDQGDAAVPLLTKVLKKSAAEDRKLAALLLGAIGNKAKPAVPTLI